jgi:hypothetical protein
MIMRSGCGAGCGKAGEKGCTRTAKGARDRIQRTGGARMEQVRMYLSSGLERKCCRYGKCESVGRFESD